MHIHLPVNHYIHSTNLTAFTFSQKRHCLIVNALKHSLLLREIGFNNETPLHCPVLPRRVFSGGVNRTTRRTRALGSATA